MLSQPVMLHVIINTHLLEYAHANQGLMEVGGGRGGQRVLPLPKIYCLEGTQYADLSIKLRWETVI